MQCHRRLQDEAFCPVLILLSTCSLGRNVESGDVRSIGLTVLSLNRP